MPKISTRESYLGIDPGASGGIALLQDGKVTTLPIPSSYKDLHEILDHLPDNVFCCIEKVGGYIGGKGHPGSAMFNFGKGVGALLMSLTAVAIPFEEVIPRTWQKGLCITPRKKDESKAEFKRRLKVHAEKLYPKVTLQNCDALLIATYCQRKRTGTL